MREEDEKAAKIKTLSPTAAQGSWISCNSNNEDRDERFELDFGERDEHLTPAHVYR